MNYLTVVTYLAATMFSGSFRAANAQEQYGQLVKMELFHDKVSGHARSDPIINQQCASGHVHTFYGPKDFHPDTTYDDLLNAPPDLSTSMVEENQSLYWHPSFYVVTENGNHIRISNMQATAYYRWDNSLSPMPEAFPPDFRMIAASTDPGADQGGPTGGNLYSECCNLMSDRLDCQLYDGGNGLVFPKKKCDFLDIVFAMPTCWNGIDNGDTNNHKDHMKFTLDGSVFGNCPNGFNHRLPQIQLFAKIREYNGVDQKYQLSDGTSTFHIDFFNGWQEGKLQEIIDDCEVIDPRQPLGEVNPQTGCTPREGDSRFLTESNYAETSVCDRDVRRLIIDEATDVVTSLPSGACTGKLIPKSWDQLSSGLFQGSCSFNGSCVEKKGGRFVMRYKRDGNGAIIKTLTKKCRWLLKKKNKTGNKSWKKICKRDSKNDEFDPAKIVCPVTCEMCV